MILTTSMSASFFVEFTFGSPSTFYLWTSVCTTSTIMLFCNFSFCSTLNIIQMTLIAISSSITSTYWFVDNWATDEHWFGQHLPSLAFWIFPFELQMTKSRMHGFCNVLPFVAQTGLTNFFGQFPRHSFLGNKKRNGT